MIEKIEIIIAVLVIVTMRRMNIVVAIAVA